uniref:Glutathione synthetaseic-like n=1 Tax=Rhizophora mucronata TaxID=61149 RepID=A0A2P2LUW0_RHIMU
MLVIHVALLRLNNNHNHSTVQTFIIVNHNNLGGSNMKKMKDLLRRSNLESSYSVQALANASANLLVAELTGTCLGSNPRCFP